MWGKGFNSAVWLCSLGLVLASVGCWRLSREIFSITCHTCQLAPGLSQETKKSIKELVANHYRASFEQMVDALKQRCPAIKTVSMQRCADHRMQITLDIFRPTIKLGQNAVLLENNMVVDAHHFTLKTLQQLPVVLLDNQTQPAHMSAECRAWLNNLDTDIFKNFILSWKDDYHIYAYQKDNTKKIIMAGVNARLEKEIIEVCQHIMNEKIQLGHGTARESWCADIRFDKQIIVSSHKGGACHG